MSNFWYYSQELFYFKVLYFIYCEYIDMNMEVQISFVFQILNVLVMQLTLVMQICDFFIRLVGRFVKISYKF